MILSPDMIPELAFNDSGITVSTTNGIASANIPGLFSTSPIMFWSI